MANIKILIAEDEENIREGIVDILESEDYEVIPAENGKKALELFDKSRVDLVMLDIMMPEINGYDVLKEIRKKDEMVPVIMLTAKSEEIDKVVGLKLGADDYITKPFGIHELLARISAILRRTKKTSNDKGKTEESFEFGSVTVNTKTYELLKDGKSIQLSEREIDLLKLFYAHPNEVLKRDFLLNEIWGIDYYGTTRTLDQHMAQLRKKVEKDPATPLTLKTIHGSGYKFVKN